MAFFRKKDKDSQPSDVVPESATEDSAAEDLDSSDSEGGVWSRFRRGLKKTRDLLKTDIRDLFKAEGRLVDEAFLGELFEILVKTDMGGKPAMAIRNEIESQFQNRIVEMEEVLGVVRDQLRDLMAQPEQPVRMAPSGPTVILVVGVNGSGKTTSIAKLANWFKSEGKSVVLGAGDTFRAAAVEQLSIWADRLGVEIVKAEQGSDPASVAHRAVAHTIENGRDVCIIDTAGRLQTQVNLMKQLEKIHRVVQGQIEDAPHEVFLVLDATAGQNGVSQAKGFSEAARCTGIILAKLDGTAKGGVVIPIRQEFEIPVIFVGQGEQPADLALFEVGEFVTALFE